MQINHNAKALKNAKNNVISFSIASLINPTHKSQLNNAEPRLVPQCWQCGTERNLLKVRTAQAAHFVCKSCGGEQ